MEDHYRGPWFYYIYFTVKSSVHVNITFLLILLNHHQVIRLKEHDWKQEYMDMTFKEMLTEILTDFSFWMWLIELFEYLTIINIKPWVLLSLVLNFGLLGTSTAAETSRCKLDASLYFLISQWHLMFLAIRNVISTMTCIKKNEKGSSWWEFKCSSGLIGQEFADISHVILI